MLRSLKERRNPMLTLNDITTLARMAGAASLWRGCCGLSFDLAKAAVPLLREQWWWDAVHSAKTDIQADPSPQSDRAAFFAARQKLLRRALRAGEMCPDDRRGGVEDIAAPTSN